MIIVGLTGGIGSGKTTVAKLFGNYSIPVYIADAEAKRLMNSSEQIKQELIELFGNNAYLNDELNKPFIADKIFNDKAYLDNMNAIIHPKVKIHFEQWIKEQNSPYVIKEVAIIFEHQQQSKYDLIITVIADKEKRLERVLSRDKTTPEKVFAIMSNQIDDIEKAQLSDFVILNNDMGTLENQIHKIHKSILQQCRNTSN
ncbi:dephospho-CoA kinase [Psychroserpens sp.]|uniref:dephospho-CoA kinase n=1 Tax=Psychroserpens sp. TaxID=2020870 RepID=UPI00385F5280